MTAPLLSPVVLREYQEEAADAIVHAFQDEGVQRQLVVLPTGTGKTRVFAALPDKLGHGRYDVTLVLAHVNELIDQAVGAFKEAGCWVEKEKAAERASPMSRIIVGSVQTMTPKRMLEFLERYKGRVRCLVIDEAHRSTSKSYRKIIEMFFEHVPDGLLVGFTATPKRTDKVAMGTVYERIVYAMDLDDAIRRAFLVPIEAYSVKTHIDLRAVKTKGADYDQTDLANTINTTGRNRIIVEAYMKVIGHRQTIIFAASIPHCVSLRNVLKVAGINARVVWGGMSEKDRKEAFELYEKGVVHALISFGLLVEGVDLKIVEAIVNARPTKSEIVFRQIVGRGLRVHRSIAGRLGPDSTNESRTGLIKASPKTKLIFLDIIDQTGKTNLLTVPSLFGLPAKMDLKGKDPLLVRNTYKRRKDEGEDESVRADERLQLGGFAEVDLFAQLRLDEEVSRATTLDWRQEFEDVHRLRLPAISRARTRSGEVVENYASRLRDSVRTFTRAGVADPVGAAFHELNIEPSSVESYEMHVDVVQTDGKFEVWRVRDGERKQLGVVDRRAEAFTRAEQWVFKAYPEAARVTKRSAKWRVEPITNFQIHRLTKRLGVKQEHLPKSKGEASALIGLLENKKAKVKRAG